LACSAAPPPPPAPSASPVPALVARYRDQKWSLGNEEIAIRDFFQDQRGGFFVDVGAGDARTSSNTYTLEARLGWRGIAVDANPALAGSWAQYRPHSHF